MTFRGTKMNSYYTSKLTEKERGIWDHAYAIFEELLDELSARGLLRLNAGQEDREKLILIWENSRNYGMAFNEIQKIFDSGESVEEFAAKSGLNTHILTYICISQLVSVMLLSYESVFKTSLLFFLKEEQGFRKNMTLGQLLQAIKKISPSVGDKIDKLVNTKIRNSVAHGTFWFKEGGKVFLARNSHLEEVEEISLADFWIEAKKINIIATAFIETLLQKIKYFSSSQWF